MASKRYTFEEYIERFAPEYKVHEETAEEKFQRMYREEFYRLMRERRLANAREILRQGECDSSR